jgi:protein-tyrosine phosphatase
MNKEDFLSKCTGAIELLKNLVKQRKKVYVHCSAGVYRSPQIVVLYLILTEKYSPEEAVEFVKSRHPFARPNQQVVTHALEVLLRDKTFRNSFLSRDCQ